MQSVKSSAEIFKSRQENNTSTYPRRSLQLKLVAHCNVCGSLDNNIEQPQIHFGLSGQTSSQESSSKISTSRFFRRGFMRTFQLYPSINLPQKK